MLAYKPWKWIGAAVLAGAAVISVVPREPAATVEEVIAGESPRFVALAGTVDVLRPNRFLLRDETGEIRLETCPPWYRPLSLQPGERVRVLGVLAPRHHWRMDLPVFVVHRLRRASGPEIVLRHGNGLPPWRHETWRTELAVSR